MKERESGRASLEDGFTSLATLLHNAMILAPFTATELRVVLYVARKTYGHARKHARGSRAIIDNQEMAQLVGCSQKSIRNVVCNLTNIRVLRSSDATRGPGASRSIGINPNVVEWGDDGEKWGQFRHDVIETWDAFDSGRGSEIVPQPGTNSKKIVPQPGTNSKRSSLSQGRTQKDRPSARDELSQETQGPQGFVGPPRTTLERRIEHQLQEGRLEQPQPRPPGDVVAVEFSEPDTPPASNGGSIKTADPPTIDDAYDTKMSALRNNHTTVDNAVRRALKGHELQRRQVQWSSALCQFCEDDGERYPDEYVAYLLDAVQPTMVDGWPDRWLKRAERETGGRFSWAPGKTVLQSTGNRDEVDFANMSDDELHKVNHWGLTIEQAERLADEIERRKETRW